MPKPTLNLAMVCATVIIAVAIHSTHPAPVAPPVLTVEHAHPDAGICTEATAAALMVAGAVHVAQVQKLAASMCPSHADAGHQTIQCEDGLYDLVPTRTRKH